MGRAGILMRKCRVGFIIHDGVFFDLSQVVFFLLVRAEH